MSAINSASAPLTLPRRRGRRLAAVRLRLRVLAQRERLDRRLIEGTDPVTSAELTLRAYQLSRPAHRRALAASVDDAVASAAVSRRRSAAAAPLARAGIEAARPELEELSRRLREEPVVAARGVALARRLLTDGSGPMYVESGEGVLRCATGEALSALDPER